MYVEFSNGSGQLCETLALKNYNIPKFKSSCILYNPRTFFPIYRDTTSGNMDKILQVLAVAYLI